MKLVTGETMCDLDGCSSTDNQIAITTYADGTQLCEWHTYLAKRMGLHETCKYCHHTLQDNSHGVDQNDFDGMEYRGRCTYCKVCHEI